MYCCVIANWFIDKNFSVIFAAGRAQNGELAVEMPLIGILSKRPRVTILDLGDVNDSYLIGDKWIAKLKELERDHVPEWTILPTGDEIQGSPRTPGDEDGSGRRTVKRAAIFIRMDHCYLRDYTHGNLVRRLRYYYNWRRDRHKKNSYFKEKIWRCLGLDIAFSTNPDFLKEVGTPRFRYLPDIYRAWGFELTVEDKRVNDLCANYRDFLSRHPGKEVLLYHGSRSARKGYDKLLYLATQESDTLFVSCFWPSIESGIPFRHDVNKMRTELERQGRIFEIESPFLPENIFFELLYSSCNFLLLPYDDFYGLSGNMMRAAASGKPALVPSIGYLASMVKKFRMGLVYRNNDYADFRRQFKRLRKDFHSYSENARQYGSGFDKEKIYAALESAFIES